MIAIPVGVAEEDLAAPGLLDTRRALSGETMGTTWSAHFYAHRKVSDEVFRQRIERELESVVAQMSHWREDSVLSRYNQAAAGEWARLPAAFYRVLEFGLAVAEETGGAFDPALGGSTDRWGFGPSGRRATPPAGEDFRVRGVWREIRMDAATGSVLQPGGAQLDLSAIAKGFAVDALAEAMAAEGAPSYLVEIGGELKGRGVKEDKQPWWVAIEAPPGCPLVAKVALCGGAMATSGDYRRYFNYEGRSYAHTLDPATGAPLVDAPASVTVVHKSCMAADAWSTALMVKGVEDGIRLSEAVGVAALFVAREDGGWRTVPNAAFQAMLD